MKSFFKVEVDDIQNNNDDDDDNDNDDDDDDDRSDEELVRFKGAAVGGITFLTKVHELRGK